jgi:SAM-dependent methyltransferase
MARIILDKFLRWVDETRAQRVVSILKPVVTGTTLDVGCWNGDVAKRLQLESIIGIDIGAPPQPQIEVRQFDGRNIPYDDRQFDTVLCCTALHHVDHQSGLIEEMKRTSRRVVILEDAYNNIFEKASVILLHAIGSRLVGMPYRISGFKSDQGWRDFFHEHGLRIVKSSNHPGVQPLWCFLRHHLYVLEDDEGGKQ